MIFHYLDVHAFNRIAKPYRLPLHNQGLVLVEGENRDGGALIPGNGAGKSLSVVETLTWGVHGRMVRYGDQQVTTEATHPQRGADVAIEVELRGLHHRLHRQRPPSGAAQFAITTRDPAMGQWMPLPLSKDPHRNGVETLLGLDYTAFCYSVVVQGADALAADGFSTQMAVLETLLRLDELGVASEEARRRTTALDRDLAAVRAEVTMGQRALESATQALEALDAQEAEAEEAIRDETAVLQADIGTSREAAQLVAPLQEEVTALRTMMDRARDQATTANASITPLLREKERIEQQQSKLVCEACGRPFGSPEETEKAKKKSEARLAKIAQEVTTLYDQKATADRQRAQTGLQLRNKEQALRTQQQAAGRLPDLEARLAALAQRTQDFATQRKVLQQQVTTHETRLAERQALLIEQQQRYQRTQHWIAGYGRDGLQADLFALGVPELNRAAHRYSDALAGQHLRVSFNPQRESRRDNLIIIEGATAPTYKGCSRGEKERVNLIVAFSLRALARWRLGEPINLSVFDEVFDHVDPGGLQAIATLLQAEIAATGGTIFVITHNPTLKALFPGAKLMRVVREGGEATVYYG